MGSAHFSIDIGRTDAYIERMDTKSSENIDGQDQLLAINHDGRFNPGGNQGYDLSKVWEHHEEIARRLCIGERAVDIAKDLGLHPQTVSNVRNNPIVKELLRIYRRERDSEVRVLVSEARAVAPKAIALMQKAIENDVFLEIPAGGEGVGGIGASSEGGDDNVKLVSKVGMPGELAAMPSVREQIQAGKEILAISVLGYKGVGEDDGREELGNKEIKGIKNLAIELRKANGQIEEAKYEDLPNRSGEDGPKENGNVGHGKGE